MSLLRKFIFCLSFLPLALPAALRAEGQSVIILDASGSMWGQIDGRAKLEIARETLGTVLSGLPAGSEIGLMAYGHRSKGDCNDIELIVPPGPGTAKAISEAAGQLKFLGKTPLSAAVRQAAGDLRFTEDKATVILITDGIETCEADPCALGNELETSGVDFTAHVVGFGLSKEEGQAVACLAENTGGRYIEAKDAAQLEEALKTTVAAAPEPEPAPQPAPEPEPAKLDYNFRGSAILAEGMEQDKYTDDARILFYAVGADGAPGEEIARTVAGIKEFIEPGRYLMVTSVSEVEVRQEIELTATSFAEPVIVLNAAFIALRALPAEGMEPDNDARMNVLRGEGIVTSGWGTLWAIVPPGPYTVATTLGPVSASEELDLTAGEQLTKDIILGAGIGRISVVYSGETLVRDNDLKVQILSPQVDIEGKRSEITYNWGNEAMFDLAPGDYIARASLDAAAVEQSFTVRTKERSDVRLDLQAGIAAILSPNGDSIEVLRPEKDIEGRQERVAYSFGPKWDVVLPAGDYIARITHDGALIDTPFTIKPGSRNELAHAGAAP